MSFDSTSLRTQRRSSIESDLADDDQKHAYVDVSPALSSETPVNAISIDVEEHFHVSAFAGVLQRSDWRLQSSRVARNMDRILGLLAESGSTATFFTLGCVAEQHPEIVKQIVKHGHEIASHGYDHTLVRNQTADQFRLDVTRTKALLEDIAGEAVTGFRAASFSVGSDTPWAHDVLAETGHLYSSSVYPINHDHYGNPAAPRFPFMSRPEGLLEIPLTTVSVFGRNLPAAGGGYFRLLPMRYSRWALKRVNRRDRMPAAFYLHPWEIDPDQPRIAGLPWKTRFRHYVNLGRFEGRLKKVLGEFVWRRMDDVYRDALPNR